MNCEQEGRDDCTKPVAFAVRWPEPGGVKRLCEAHAIRAQATASFLGVVLHTEPIVRDADWHLEPEELKP